MKKIAAFTSILVFSMIFSACGSTVEYGDASKDKGSAEWGPKEIKMTTSMMVGSIYSYLKDEWKQPAFLQVKKFQNKTSEHIDTKMISEEIVTQLIKKRISFVDDSLTAEALEEMEKGMSGMIDPDSAVPMGYLKSPNMYLTGDVRDNVRTVKGKNIQYLVVTLKLYNLKTGIIMWQEQKEFLKTSKNTKISF